MVSFFLPILPILIPAAVFWAVSQHQKRNNKLPPGPRSKWFGVNDKSKDMPVYYQAWKMFNAYMQIYGPIFSLKFGTDLNIVVGKPQIAWDLMEKRGEIYSDRPRRIAVNEILSAGLRGVTLSYGEKWRRWRKVQHAGLNTRTSREYRHFQALESSTLLRELAASPDAWVSRLERYATSIIVSVVYGRRVESLDEHIVQENRLTTSVFVKACAPGKYLVDSWPILLKLPKSLQWFRRELDDRQKKDQELYVGLFRDVGKRMQEGTAKECFSTRILTPGGGLEGGSEVENAYAASASFLAGIETTTSTMETFFHCMLLYPETMKKAQAEIDAVVGPDRVPKFADEMHLPYTRALIKEVERWSPPLPLGVSHAVAKDDIYEGMLLPKGATIQTNIDIMTRDPELFPEPYKFRPERFLETDNPRLIDFTLTFGFGRRICPGMDVANQSIYINVCRILWAFDLSPPVSAKGEPILPDPEGFVGTGLLRRPAAFKWVATPRNAGTLKIIEDEAAQSDIELKEWD